MSSHASLLPAGTPRSAFGKLLAAEARFQWRVPVGLILGIGVPVMLVIIFGLVPAMNSQEEAEGGLTMFSWMFPSLIMMALIILSLVNLPEHLADYRQQGILRRGLLVRIVSRAAIRLERAANRSLRPASRSAALGFANPP